MKAIKKLWKKCGEEKFSGRVMCGVVTFLTVTQLLFWPEYADDIFAVIMVLANGAVVAAQILFELDEEE